MFFISSSDLKLDHRKNKTEHKLLSAVLILITNVNHAKKHYKIAHENYPKTLTRNTGQPQTTSPNKGPSHLAHNSGSDGKVMDNSGAGQVATQEDYLFGYMLHNNWMNDFRFIQVKQQA